MVGDEIKIRLLKLNASLLKFGIPMREIQKNYNPDVNVSSYLQEKNRLNERLSLLFSSCGMSTDNSVYYIMVNIFKFSLLLEKGLGMISIGEKATGKSGLYNLIFTEMATVVSGLPTEAELRGDARSNNKEENTSLLEKSVLVFEEISNGNNSQLDKILSLVKDVLMRGKYLKNKTVEEKVLCSIMINANNYSRFKNLGELQGKDVLSSLPSPFQYDSALIDRFPFVLPHYKTLFGKIKYPSEVEVIPITVLENFITQQRKKKTFFIEIDKEISSRLLKSTTLVISGIIKLLYSEIEKEEDIPKWLINGIVEFAIHFNSIANQEVKVYSPFNSNSLEFILEILGYDIKNIKFALFHKERLIIGFKKKQVIYKIALTGFGIEENKKEVEFSQNSSEDLLATIEKISSDFRVIQYKPHDFYTSKLITYSTKGLDFKSIKEHNEDLVKIIQVSVDLQKDTNFSDDKFEGIPDFQLKLLKKEVQRIFSFSNETATKISRKNFAIDKNGKIRLINFSEFIEC